MSTTSSGGGDPWKWLGLLKWSLEYVDGTSDSSDISPMSEEDKKFLETVMREGIVDEGKRMKSILDDLAKAMEYYQSKSLGTSKQENPPISEAALEDLLQELRDIVEQIDYARAFCSLKGIEFLIGCVTQGTAVPESIQTMCMGILATLCQNNPPVQKELLEMGAIKTLSDVFFLDTTSQNLKARTMQAISSMVRNHQLAETVFCNLDQAESLIMAGLDPVTASQNLKTRTIFFLRALITSDTATSDRIRGFASAIGCIADNFVETSNPPEIREISLALLVQILEQKRETSIVLERKDSLAALGVERVSTIRGLTGEEREFAQLELDHWELLMVLLARTTPDTK